MLFRSVQINIPPLRERKEEIVPLAEWRLEHICQKYGFSKKALSAESKEKLLSYEWVGNIRELLSVIENAAIMSEGDEINPNDLFLDSRIRSVTSGNKIEDLEKNLISEVLLGSGGDVTRASEILGMQLDILRHKIAKYGIKAK